MKELMEAIAETVCAAISYAITDSGANAADVTAGFVRLGEAIEAFDTPPPRPS